MSTKHRFVARIDSNLWNDLKKIKKTMGNTSSINTSINESIRLFRDNMMDKISKQRRRRESQQFLGSLFYLTTWNGGIYNLLHSWYSK